MEVKLIQLGILIITIIFFAWYLPRKLNKSFSNEVIELRRAEKELKERQRIAQDKIRLAKLEEETVKLEVDAENTRHSILNNEINLDQNKSHKEE